MPLEIDLNISPSDEDIGEEILHFNGEKNFDLIQPAASQVLLDSNHEVPCEEDEENQQDVGVHEAVGQTQPPEFDVIHSEIEHEEEQQSFAGPEAIISDGTSSKRKFLNNDDRRAISHLLLQSSCDGIIKEETKRSIASFYSVSVGVIGRIWKQTKETGDASHKRTKNCGRKRVQLDYDQFSQLPLSNRTTLRDLASSLNIGKTSLVRLQKHGLIRRHSNSIKPLMKEENMIARLKFCLSMLENDTIPHDPTFKAMYNIVHIDEKWFYMTKKSVNYYLLPDEEEPLRSCKSKNFIRKVMFLVAIARPTARPFVTKELAKRNSVNRVAGTLETKPITSVNKEISRSFLIEQVVPAIKAKWPRDEICNPIFIQQDNARSHINPNNIEFCRVSSEDGFDIRLMCQPPNSPDLNVLDLGFFSAIQALQYKKTPNTIDELVGDVVNAFESFSSIESNKIFLTLQTCMVEIMKEKGSNNYKIPHIKKEVLRREGLLPTQIKCDPSLVEEVVQLLRTITD